MPLEIQDFITRELKTLIVPIEHPDTGEPLGKVTVTYDPLAYNWKIEHSLQVEAMTLPAGTVREVLCTFIQSWDLTNGGVPIPVTPEGLLLVDFRALQVPIANAVISDVTGTVGKAPRTASSSRLSTARPRPSKSKAKAASPGRR